MDLSHNILSLLTWLPIFGGMAVLIAGDGDDPASSRAAGMRSLSLAVSLLTFVFSIFLFSNFDTTTASMQFVERAPWIEGDEFIIDGVRVNGTANTVRRLAGVLRHLQTGYLYHYAFAMFIGLTAFLGWILWF